MPQDIPNDIPKAALERLLENKKLNRKAVARFQRECVPGGPPLEQLLVEAGELDRLTYLDAASQVTGIPSFNLQAQKIKYSRAQTLPREVAEQIPALPVAFEDGNLVVVFADPTDTFAVERVATLTRLQVSPRVTYNPDLPGAIEKAFAVKVERIGADTPHHQESPPADRPAMKFATATRTPDLGTRLRDSVVNKMGASRTVKIDGFVTAAAAPQDSPVDTPQEKLEFLERNLIQLTGAGDFQAKLDTLVQSARTVCRADGASLLLLSEDRTELFFASVAGDNAEALMKIRLPLDEHSVAGFSVLRRQTLRVSDAATDPRQSKQTDAAIGYRTRSLIAAPLTWAGEPLGVLEVVNKLEGTFDDDDVEFMQLLATQTAIAVQLAHQSRQVQAFRQRTLEVLEELLERSGLQKRAHGELVARVAVALGRELELSAAELERLEAAARLHEASRLQDGDRDLEIGLFRTLSDVAAVVAHQRTPYRGGPPDQPMGLAIPRLSRILALAVAWIEGLERAGLAARREVLREILAECGTRYDPALKIPFEIAVQAVTPPG